MEGVESIVDSCLDFGGIDVGIRSDGLNLGGNLLDLLGIGLADLKEHIKLFAKQQWGCRIVSVIVRKLFQAQSFLLNIAVMDQASAFDVLGLIIRCPLAFMLDGSGCAEAAILVMIFGAAAAVVGPHESAFMIGHGERQSRRVVFKSL